MRKSRKIYCFLAVLFVAIIALHSLFTYLQDASKIGHVHGNISAMMAAIYSELDKGNDVLKDIFCKQSQNWAALTNEQYDLLISELVHKDCYLDHVKGWEPSMPMTDGWGNRYKLYYRVVNGDQYDILIISNGPDGRYGTEDDIIHPVDASLPPT